VPALLTGRRFSAFTHPAPDDLILTPVSGGGTVALASQPTIFSEARQKGFNVGIAGWYLPYCRLFPDCTACSWSPFALTQGEVSDSQSMPQMMASLFLGQVREIPFCNRLGLKARESARNREFHAGAYWQIHREMLRDAVDPRLNLVYVHMCVPHLPAIYVAAHDTFTSGGGSTYIDNLRLVDRTIGDLRRTLEAHGMWDASTILLTADHPLRVAYWPKAALAPGPIEQHAEVPYLLKLAGQKQALSYDKPLQELVTKNLLLAILARQITVPEDVPAWLEQHPPAQ
jgi:hypothetical protein